MNAGTFPKLFAFWIMSNLDCSRWFMSLFEASSVGFGKKAHPGSGVIMSGFISFPYAKAGDQVYFFGLSHALLRSENHQGGGEGIRIPGSRGEDVDCNQFVHDWVAGSWIDQVGSGFDRIRIRL